MSDEPVSFDADFMAKVSEYLNRDPLALLHVPHIRKEFVAARMKQLIETRGVNKTEPGSLVNKRALEKNYGEMLKLGTFHRPEVLINPLSSITSVRKLASQLRVLSVGPRTEAEIFVLMLNGFRLENISALDLFSYSPWIEAGDMHAMPYGDQSFDVCVAGWVLTYSTDPKRAAKEILRVTKPGGHIAIGWQYFPADHTYFEQEHPATLIESTAQIRELFAEGIKRVIVDSDLDPAHAGDAYSLIYIFQRSD
ncbi:MAG: class I SAM-dependent methyltransferase [Proteobacteria bacterium]|nr:class I SAM-dependent methyltransferase [Pseudomonadota bacterium]